MTYPDRLEFGGPNPRTFALKIARHRRQAFLGGNDDDRNGEQSEGQRSPENPARPNVDSARFRNRIWSMVPPAHRQRRPTRTRRTQSRAPRQVVHRNSDQPDERSLFRILPKYTAAITPKRHHGQGHQNTISTVPKMAGKSRPPYWLLGFAGDKCQRFRDIATLPFKPTHRIRPTDGQDLIERETHRSSGGKVRARPLGCLLYAIAPVRRSLERYSRSSAAI